MKRYIIRRILVNLINRFRQSRLKRWLFSYKQQNDMLSNFQPMCNFTAEDGFIFTLYKGYRDALCPNWRMMFTAPGSDSYEELSPAKLSKAKEDLQRVEHFLSIFGLSFLNKKILEIGCNDGLITYTLANLFDAEVIGTDLARYYLFQTDGLKINEKNIQKQNERLSQIREKVKVEFNKKADNECEQVSFIEDDITDSKIDNNSVDCIFSWEVLEHIADPCKAFNEMFRILKPGGFAFHEYNPFFCRGGGHSLCTLDFPYGHVRLSASDFKGYIKMIRPDEETVAIQFYENNLNRMTLRDLESYVKSADLKVLSIIPWLSKNNLLNIDENILMQAKSNYKTVSAKDLLSDLVWVILEKPY